MLEAAADTLQAMLKGRPDTDRESDNYRLEMLEMLAHLTPEEHAWVSDPREGLATRCKYLPTPADVHELIRERRAAEERKKPVHTTWNKLKPDDPDAPWNRETDYERKARVVREALGYDPLNRTQAKRTFTPPTTEDLKNLKLKSPDKPITLQLLALLEAEGWPFLPSQDSEAA